MAESIQTIEIGSINDEWKNKLSALGTAKGEARSELLKNIQQYAVKKVDEWKSEVVYIGIIGDPGAGKSTFINSFRGLKATKKGAAKVGLKHTTKEVTEYPHPKRPDNLILVDFPGVLLKKGQQGGMAFNIQQYLDDYGEKMNLCDVFLVFTSFRIQHNAVQIGMEARKMGKNILFVRSKFDVDLKNQEEDDPYYLKENSKEDLMEGLREDYIEVLKDVGWLEDVKPEDIFIISGRLPAVLEGSFDMPKLRKAMIDDLDDLKKMVVINTCRDYSKGMVEEKAQVYRNQVWQIALAATAASVVPALGTASVPAAWIAAYHQYKQGFGIDDESLEHLAKMTRKNPTEFKDFVQSRLTKGSGTPEGVVQAILGVLSSFSTSLMTAVIVDQVVDYSIPVIGAVITAPVSFGINYKVLNKVIAIQEQCAKDLFDLVFRDSAV